MNAATLVTTFSQWHSVALVVAGIIGGEDLIIGMVFLAAAGWFSLWQVAVFVTAGEMLSDCVAFALGRVPQLRLLLRYRRVRRLYTVVDKVITTISGGSVLRMILYSKFTYGTRLAMAVYLSAKGVAWRRFLAIDVPILMLWMAVTITVGVVTSHSAAFVGAFFGATGRVISLVAAFVCIVLVLQYVLRRRVKRYLASVR